ncbi:MAG: SDR family NAD(P)-dependent oxidoreductase [Enterococcus sp.]
MGNVLITGGTSGIGFSLAKEFAKKGETLILVSSNQANLEHARTVLQKISKKEIIIIQQDLSQLGAAEKLFEKLPVAIDILINNAGFGLVGETEKIPYHEDESLMMLNVVNLVGLCKLILPSMYQKGAGKILNVASTGAFQPGPYTATYFASKAFVLSYSRGVRYEAKKRGVQICTLCPGATRTKFFSREQTSVPKTAMTSDEVAKIAIHKLMENQSVTVPGLKNRFMLLFPEAIRIGFVAKMKNRDKQNE